MLNEKDHERNLYLKPDKLMKIIQACQQVRSKHYLPAIILLGAEHGAAKQEILSLKWSDISFDYEDKVSLLVGANLKDVKEMIGHSEIKMTDRYSHIAGATKIALQDKLAAHYNGVYPKSEPTDEIATAVKAAGLGNT
jgi:integrase